MITFIQYNYLKLDRDYEKSFQLVQEHPFNLFARLIFYGQHSTAQLLPIIIIIIVI